MKQTKILKITITGTKQERADQFKLLTEFADMTVQDLTIENTTKTLKNIKVLLKLRERNEETK